jgi:serine/threonine protein kinase
LLQVNILITPTHRACLADFGLTTIADSQLLGWSTATSNASGTARWLAPELLVPESESNNDNCRLSLNSDIYSFACVGYEVAYFLVPRSLFSLMDFCFADFHGTYPFP